MDKLKLCFLTNNINQFGGIERVISILTTYFSQNKKWNITIISLYTDENCPAFDFSNNVDIIHGKLKIGDNIKTYLLDFLSFKNFSIIFTFHPTIGLEFLQIRNHFPHLHWIACEHSSPYDYTWKRRLLNLGVYARADRLIVLTETAKKYYKNRLIFHTEVIPNALSFETDKSSDIFAKKIIAIGRLERVKRFDLLIEAFALIAEKNPDWILELVGDGTQRIPLQQQVLNYRLENQIRFLGYQKNVKELCLQASFCVISSEYEGFSLAALETLECGLPLISVDLPSIREIVRGYTAASFVPQRRTDRLAKEMQHLINSPEKLQHMAVEAKKCAANYHISRIGEMWEKVIGEVQHGNI